MPKRNLPELLGPDFLGSSSAGCARHVYVIDDDLAIRQSLHFLLATSDFVAWPFASASDFLENLDSLEPAPILLDIRMPKIDGIQLMTMLLERDNGWPIIVMTAHGEIPVAVEAIKLGAIEFLEKPFDFETLKSALQIAYGQLATISEASEIRKRAKSLFKSLSPREAQVLNLLVQGIPNKVAAHLLSLSGRTIEMHRSNALAKLDVKTIAEVVRLMNEAGRLIGNDDKEVKK